MNTSSGALEDSAHQKVFIEKILPASGLQEASTQPHPKAVILAGQPGAGKGGLTRSANLEFRGDVVTVDPDLLRDVHPNVGLFRREHPYTWSDDTHPDASRWARQLREMAIDSRKNLIIDTTLGDARSAAKLIDDLKTHGYDVEVRAMATHRLESELGVDKRFGESLDQRGFGRYVPQSVREHIYDNLPGNLDHVRSETGVTVRIFNREGHQFYDSRVDSGLPSDALRQARDSRLADPKITHTVHRGYQEQTTWHKDLPRSLDQNPKIDRLTAQNVLTERQAMGVEEHLRPLAREAAAVDQVVRVQPTLGKVARIGAMGSAAFAAYDAAESTHKATQLAHQGNATGAQSEILHFGSRTVGMVGGAKLGGMVGAAAGMETGPGALVTGTVGAVAGGVIGSVAGDKLADAVDRQRIYTQSDPQGHTWSYDPDHPSQGWTRTESTLDAAASRLNDGFPVYKQQDFTADPALADRLNYQASGVAAELQLAHAAPVDPYRIPASKEDDLSAVGGDWVRDPASKTWSRTVHNDVSEFGVPEIQIADAAKAATLERQSAGIVARNAEQTPAVIAERYQSAYKHYGWQQHGSMPEAVTNALKTPANKLEASDGHSYTQGSDGTWTRHGWLGDKPADGNVRDELDHTQQQQRKLEKSTTAAPVTPSSLSPKDAATPARLDHPTHPDHALYSHTRSLVHQLDQQNGRTPDQRSDQLAASLAVSARASGLQRIDKIALSDDASTLWAVQRPAGMRDAFFDRQCKVATMQALNTSIEQSSAQWPHAMQQFHQHQEQAQARQQDQQAQAQAAQQSAPGMSR